MASDVTTDWLVGQAPEGQEPMVAVQCACGAEVRVVCGGAVVKCEECGRRHEALVIRRTLPAEEGCDDE